LEVEGDGGGDGWRLVIEVVEDVEVEVVNVPVAHFTASSTTEVEKATIDVRR